MSGRGRKEFSPNQQQLPFIATSWWAMWVLWFVSRSSRRHKAVREASSVVGDGRVCARWYYQQVLIHSVRCEHMRNYASDDDAH